MKALKYTVVLVAVGLLAACGTYSEMTASDGGEPVLPVYQTAIVLDFGDETEPKTSNPEKLEEHRETLRIAGRHFADILASQLKKNKMYESVAREPTDQEALVISGDITRYSEGSSAARLWIGLGAGSSYFDAVIRFTDNKTGGSLGEMIIDKNSWVLGGAIAATQSVDAYMNNAAKKLVEEIQEARDAMQVLKAAKERQAATVD